MKKFIVFIMLVMATQAFAVGSSIISDPVRLYGNVTAYGNMYILTISFVADASDGSFDPVTMTDTQASDLTGYWLSHVKVNPGTTGPTDNSDLTVKWGGVDVLGGNGVNIVDNAVEGYCTPKGTNADAQWPMSGEALTIGIVNNAVNSATVEVQLVFDK